MFRVINGATVRELFPIGEAIGCMRDALVAYSAGQLFQHPRVAVAPPGEGGQILLMPAMSGGTVGLKVLSMFPRAAERGLPGVQGIVLLIDAVHGEPLALIDGITVTEIRTAAVTTLATAEMAVPDAQSLALIGAGAQARSHLAGLATLTAWKRIRVYSRTASRVKQLADWAAESLGLTIEAAESPAAAVRGADVVCTVTSSLEPVLADADIAESGIHINAIGAFGVTGRELPSELVARSRIVVDSREAALAEAGDILVPMGEGVLAEDAVAGELGEVLAGKLPGRLGGEVSVFKSLGLPIEDTVACQEIYRRAVARGLGEEIAFP
jgi:ornithine cyclodeaminase/alanine dehydrogenase-like protein (mu-crystallin family)